MTEPTFIIRTTRDPQTGQIIKTKVSIPLSNPITPEMQQLRDLAIKNEELKTEIRDLKARIKEMEYRQTAKTVTQPIIAQPSKESLLALAIEHPELIKERDKMTLTKDPITGAWVEHKVKGRKPK